MIVSIIFNIYENQFIHLEIKISKVKRDVGLLSDLMNRPFFIRKIFTELKTPNRPFKYIKLPPSSLKKNNFSPTQNSARDIFKLKESYVVF